MHVISPAAGAVGTRGAPPHVGPTGRGGSPRRVAGRPVVRRAGGRRRCGRPVPRPPGCPTGSTVSRTRCSAAPPAAWPASRALSIPVRSVSGGSTRTTSCPNSAMVSAIPRTACSTRETRRPPTGQGRSDSPTRSRPGPVAAASANVRSGGRAMRRSPGAGPCSTSSRSAESDTVLVKRRQLIAHAGETQVRRGHAWCLVDRAVVMRGRRSAARDEFADGGRDFSGEAAQEVG